MITVEAIKYREAREDAVSENYGQYYRDREGLVRIERCSFQSTSDFAEDSVQYGRGLLCPGNTVRSFRRQHLLSLRGI